MDKKTLTALRGSIAKWRAIVDGTGEDRGSSNCPLCEAFYDSGHDEGDICFGCPVAQVKMSECDETPYWDWRVLFSRGPDFPFRATTPEKKAAAQAELDFLISLLPEGESACVEVDGAARA